METMKEGRVGWKVPLIAAVGGLALGLLLRKLPSAASANPDPIAASSVAGNSHKTGKSGRLGGATGSPILKFMDELSTATVGRCGELFDEMLAARDGRRDLELQAVFARWMELVEPATLLETLKTEDDGKGLGFWSSAFFEAWAAKDPAAAMAGTTKNSEFAQSRALVSMRRGDGSFLTENLEIWDSDRSAIADGLTVLGMDYPELAKGVADYKGGKPDGNGKLIASVASGMARKDPRAALEWVQSLGLNAENLKEAANSIFGVWLRNDWDGAMAAAKSTSVDTFRGGSFEDSWSQLRDTNNATNLQALMIRQNPFADVKDLYQRISEASVDWKNKPISYLAIEGDGWFVADPGRALAEAEGLPPGKARDFLMKNLCELWADRHPEEAAVFAEAHGLQIRLSRHVSDVEAIGANPAATLSALVSEGDADTEIPQKLMTMAMRWAESDPQSAAEWLLGRPDSVVYNYQSDPTSATLLSNTLGYSWAKVDAVSASQWVQDLPEGQRKSEAWDAMRGYVHEYASDYAFISSVSILQGDRRLDSLKSDLGKVVSSIGLPAARELLQTTEMAAEERAVLQKSLETPPAP